MTMRAQKLAEELTSAIQAVDPADLTDADTSIELQESLNAISAHLQSATNILNDLANERDVFAEAGAEKLLDQIKAKVTECAQSAAALSTSIRQYFKSRKGDQ